MTKRTVISYKKYLQIKKTMLDDFTDIKIALKKEKRKCCIKSFDYFMEILNHYLGKVDK